MATNNRKRGNDEKREKIKKKYNTAERAGLEVRRACKEKSIFDSGGIMRVGVYCRVSTGNTEQLTSYIMQQKYYSEFVERHEGWVLAGIYADEGISGTSLKHRDEFLRMMKDCEDGNLDLIVVKSVSRFSRCTEDFLKCIKDLTNHKPPIGVFFENEGIYTLDDSKQLTLTLLAGFAQEESHAKSTNMNSSVEQRFSQGIFLTPPLLGYDSDENGNLVINESEADTVRLIFYMYLYGYTCDVIADTLTVLKRQTKLGNTKWSPSTVRGVLQNERHCGDIIARKTWTPDYLDHKSKKNRPDKNGEYDKNQYTGRNHHERIITRDDFIAVSHMMANAKYGGRSFMPELRVVSGGALHGFVSVNPRWGAFKPEDYRFASNSVGVPKRDEYIFQARRGEIDFRGYEIARTQFFSTMAITSGTFSCRDARFSGECIRKLGSAEYIELLVQPYEKMFAVRECSPEHRNAIRWANLIGDVVYTRQFGGTAFLRTIFDILEWNYDLHYRLRGAVRSVAGETVAFFDAQEVEIIIPLKSVSGYSLETDYLIDSDADDYYISTRTKYRIVAIPVLWQSDFGSPYYQQIVRNAYYNSAGYGTDLEYNTEPDVRPTSRETLVGNIAQLFTKFKDVETQNG